MLKSRRRDAESDADNLIHAKPRMISGRRSEKGDECALRNVTPILKMDQCLYKDGIIESHKIF